MPTGVGPIPERPLYAWSNPLKQKRCHFDEIFGTVCIGSCDENFIKNDDISVSVFCYFGIWDLFHKTWWRHQMETFSALLALCAGNSPVTGEFPHKGHWRGTLMFSLICALTYNWVNNKDAGDLRRHRAHYDVTVMMFMIWPHNWNLVNDNCFICSCRDICKIVTWSKHYFSRKNSVDFL